MRGVVPRIGLLAVINESGSLGIVIRITRTMGATRTASRAAARIMIATPGISLGAKSKSHSIAITTSEIISAIQRDGKRRCYSSS